MNDKLKINRREFLELTAMAAGAMVLNGAGCTGNRGREQYKIFSAGQIGNLQIKNRLIRSATFETAAINGEVTDTYISLLRNLAEGGVGMIITGVLGVFKETEFDLMVQIYDDRYIDGLIRVRNAVRAADSTCKLIAQLYHPGPTVGPSTVNWPGKQPRTELSTEEIAMIVTGFAEAIRRVKAAGWDGVEVHGAHQYLLASFLSPYTNKREDSYGGSVENRVRIIAEIMSEARNRVGSDFPILIKLNGTDEVEGGIDLDSFPEIAREVVKTGVDAIDVSGQQPCRQYVNTPQQQSYFLKYAEALDAGLPIICTGGNRSVELLEDIVQENKVAFLGLSRPLVREPELANRWLAGTGNAAAECISCNNCTSTIGIEPLHCVFKAA